MVPKSKFEVDLAFLASILSCLVTIGMSYKLNKKSFCYEDFLQY